MEMTMNMSAFEQLDNREMMRVDGGFVLALGTVLFTVGKISVTIGMCLKAGAAAGLVAGGAVVLS